MGDPNWTPMTRTPVPHPVLGCHHAEGAVLDAGQVVRWLPGVHDCAYIDTRNAALEAGTPLPFTRVRPIGR